MFKTITISSLNHDLSKNRVVIKDQNNLTYSFFTKNNDGTDTPIFREFLGQQLTSNSIIGIEYVEKQSTFNGQQTTFRNITRFNEGEINANVPPFSTPTEAEKHQSDKWDKISEGKVKHAFALEAYKQGKELNTGIVNSIGLWVDYVMSGKLEEVIQPEEFDGIGIVTVGD